MSPNRFFSIGLDDFPHGVPVGLRTRVVFLVVEADLWNSSFATVLNLEILRLRELKHGRHQIGGYRLDLCIHLHRCVVVELARKTNFILGRYQLFLLRPENSDWPSSLGNFQQPA